MKRILLISNDAITLSSSNGRTMMMLLRDYDKDYIAQFFIHGQIDQTICSTYYCVSDHDALRALLGKKIKHHTYVHASKDSLDSEKKINRSCRNMVIREAVWRSYRWWNKDFTDWLYKFSPEAVILQTGDCPFMFNITKRIHEMFHIPVVIYQSESYSIRKKIYHSANEKSVWHKMLKHILDKQYDGLMAIDPVCVYITESLKNAYQKRYPNSKMNYAIYTGSELEHITYQPKKQRSIVCSYCGNLGGGRDRLLLRFAKILLSVDSGSKLILCGKEIKNESFQELIHLKNVEYMGTVPYEKVKAVIADSDLILHCEDEERFEARYHAFSTKIADCLKCGVPFMVISSKAYPFVQYLEGNDAAFVCESDEEISKVLKKIVCDLNYRCSHLRAACELANANHDTNKNAAFFTQLINNI